jgi:hypothetical protein
MSTKVCIQHKFIDATAFGKIHNTKFVGVKVIDDPATLAGYNFPYTIGRRYFSDAVMADWNARLSNPTAFAAWWWAQVRNDTMIAPLARWEVVNEFCPPDKAAQFAAFEIVCMQLAEVAGIKLVIGNFATGNPPDMAWWAAYRPALDYARVHGHSFGQHGYWGIQNGQTAKWEWNLDRLEKVRAAHPGILDGIDVFLTETGIDRVEDIDTPGWKTCVSKEAYLEQIGGFLNQLLNNRNYIKAAFLYIRSKNAPNYDIEELDAPLFQFVNAANSGLPVPVPPIEEIPPLPGSTPVPALTTGEVYIRRTPVYLANGGNVVTTLARNAKVTVGMKSGSYYAAFLDGVQAGFIHGDYFRVL